MKVVRYVGREAEIIIRVAGGTTYTFRQGKAIPVRPNHLSLFEGQSDFEISSPELPERPVEPLAEAEEAEAEYLAVDEDEELLIQE